MFRIGKGASGNCNRLRPFERELGFAQGGEINLVRNKHFFHAYGSNAYQEDAV